MEVPKSWSALATKIAVSKYFYGDIANGTNPHKGGRESSVRQLIHRVTRTIADWGLADGYFEDAQAAQTFYDELTWLCLNQYAAFNSPVWFNVGLYHEYGVGKGAAAIFELEATEGSQLARANRFEGGRAWISDGGFNPALACFELGDQARKRRQVECLRARLDVRQSHTASDG